MTTLHYDPPGENPLGDTEGDPEDPGEWRKTKKPFVMDALAWAIYLADKLARVDKKPAYVINVDGHPHLASHLDFGDDGQAPYWTRDQIVYTAS